MYQIQTLNKISPVGLKELPEENYRWGDAVEAPDAILVRSASMHDMDLPDSVAAIARAGAGVNNIPIDKCSSKGIVVFNTPGANANAVKELVLLGLLMSCRKVVPALEWIKTLKGQGSEVSKLVEKGKSQFTGPELMGKSLGVIGLGAIGVLVANAAQSLGMTVYGYDPYLSVDAAWGLSKEIRHATSLREIYEKSDFITLHLPCTADTKGMINAASLASMKDGVRLLNFARGELVESAALLTALEQKKVEVYVTDFADDALLNQPGVIALPHLGASTPESEDNCARMAAQELKTYLETGNIYNSVNLPAVNLPRSAEKRICIIHKNIAGMLSKISTVLSGEGINIENMISASRKAYAYSIFDVSTPVEEGLAQKISEVPDVIRVRII